MNDELQRHIVYDEYQVKYLQDAIDDEIRYKQKAKRDEKINHRKLVIYYILTVILVCAFIIFISWELYFAFKMQVKTYKTSNGDQMIIQNAAQLLLNSALPISLILVGPIMVFAGAFLIICVVKLVKYSKRIKGDIDWKTFRYKEYTQMYKESDERLSELKKELQQMNIILHSDQALLQARCDNPGSDMQTIDTEELSQITMQRDNIPQIAADTGMGRILSEFEMYERAVAETEKYRRERLGEEE